MNRILQLGTKIASRSDRLISSSLSTLATQTNDPLLRLSSSIYDFLGGRVRKGFAEGADFYNKTKEEQKFKRDEQFQTETLDNNKDLLSTTNLILEKSSDISEKLDKLINNNEKQLILEKDAKLNELELIAEKAKEKTSTSKNDKGQKQGGGLFGFLRSFGGTIGTILKSALVGLGGMLGINLFGIIKTLAAGSLALVGATGSAGLFLGAKGLAGLGALGTAGLSAAGAIGKFALKRAGPLAIAAGLFSSILDAVAGWTKAETTGLNQTVSGIAGFLGGYGEDKITRSLTKAGDFAAIGGGMGLIFGPLGAIAGAALGGILGAITGAIGGDKIAQTITDIGKWTEEKFIDLVYGTTELIDKAFISIVGGAKVGWNWIKSTGRQGMAFASNFIDKNIWGLDPDFIKRQNDLARQSNDKLIKSIKDLNDSLKEVEEKNSKFRAKDWDEFFDLSDQQLAREVIKKEAELEREKEENRLEKLKQNENSLRKSLSTKNRERMERRRRSFKFQKRTIPDRLKNLYPELTGEGPTNEEVMRFNHLSDKKTDETIGQSNKWDNLIPEGIDKNLVRAIISQESSGNPNAININANGTKDIGLMQINEETWKNLQKIDPTLTDIWDPKQNIKAGTMVLQENLKTFGGDVKKALGAYNAGPKNVMDYFASQGKKGFFPEKYVSSVLSNLENQSKPTLAMNGLVEELSKNTDAQNENTQVQNKTNELLEKTSEQMKLESLFQGLLTPLGALVKGEFVPRAFQNVINNYNTPQPANIGNVGGVDGRGSSINDAYRGYTGRR